MRMNPSGTGNLSYEEYTGMETNTIKKLVMSSTQSVSEIPKLQVIETDFDSGKVQRC